MGCPIAVGISPPSVDRLEFHAESLFAPSCHVPAVESEITGGIAGGIECVAVPETSALLPLLTNGLPIELPINTASSPSSLSSRLSEINNMFFKCAFEAISATAEINSLNVDSVSVPFSKTPPDSRQGHAYVHLIHDFLGDQSSAEQFVIE